MDMSQPYITLTQMEFLLYNTYVYKATKQKILKILLKIHIYIRYLEETSLILMF